jgi:hypothetical protein
VRLLTPWALVGLVAIAGPIAAHLLARRPPKRLRFPNLRFLPQTMPIPAQRNRLTDLGLLALRIAILAMAALALTGPTFVDSLRPAASPDANLSMPSPPPAAAAATPASTTRELTMLTGPAERAGAEAALAAAIRLGAPARIAGDRDVALVFPGFEAREALLRDAAPLSQSWMSDLFTAVANDQLVTAAATRLNRAPLDLIRVVGDRTKPGRMLISIDAPPHSLISAAITSALLRSAASAPLRSVSSGPSSVSSPLEETVAEPAQSTLSRFFWIAVAILLLIETVVRRRRPASQHTEEHARVA